MLKFLSAFLFGIWCVSGFGVVEVKGDPVKGEALYRKCIMCHGKGGEGKKSQKAPYIKGQYDWYVYKQLVMMKNKERINKAMEPYVTPLEDQDFQDLAAYISQL